MAKVGELQLIKRLWPYARGQRFYLLVALLMTPLSMALALLQPWLLKKGIDEYIMVPGKLADLSYLASMFLGVVVLHYIVSSVYALSLAVAGQYTILQLREKVFRHLLGLAPAFFDKKPAGELLTRATSDIESLGETLGSGVITIILDVLMIVGILGMMFWLHWQLTLVLLAVSPILMWLLTFFRRRLRHYFVIIRDSLASVNAFLAERLAGVLVVQLFNHEEETHRMFVERNKVFRDATVRSNVYDALMYAVVDGVGSICIALMLWYSTSGLLGQTISIGLFVAFLEYLQRLFRPLQEFSGKIAIIQRATTALEKIFSLLDDSEEIEEGRKPVENAKGLVQFRNVSFSYRSGEDILKNVSFEVKPGEVVAIVGSTGSGKTTITRLINRFYSGYRGSILFDGVELRDCELKGIRSAVAAVRQDIHLFSETIRFNVGLDNPVLDDLSLEKAASLVHADGFIEELSEDWSHVLRERGSNLSVGEGQLLTFARTMAYDPPVVILDEATASIDSETEALIQDAIVQILKRKTVIVIAHRLSTIVTADRILVMDEGRIVEEGSHQELLAKKGHYHSLFHAGFQ